MTEEYMKWWTSLSQKEKNEYLAKKKKEEAIATRNERQIKEIKELGGNLLETANGVKEAISANPEIKTTLVKDLINYFVPSSRRRY
jgi:hypothetical protein